MPSDMVRLRLLCIGHLGASWDNLQSPGVARRTVASDDASPSGAAHPKINGRLSGMGRQRRPPGGHPGAWVSSLTSFGVAR